MTKAQLISQMEAANMLAVNSDPKLKAIWVSVKLGDTVLLGKSSNGSLEQGVLIRKSAGCLTIQEPGVSYTISRTGRYIKSVKLIAKA